MSVSGRIARNTATKWAASLIAAATAFFLVKFQLIKLGESGYGAAELVTTIVYVSILTDLGLRAALSRHLAEQVALADPKRLNEFFNSALSCYLLLGVGIALFCGVFANPLATALKVPPDDREAVVFLIRYYVTLTTLISLVAPSYAAVLEANHRFDLVDITHISEVLLRASGIVFMLGYAQTGLYGWAAAMVFSKLTSLALYAGLAHRYCPQLRISWRYLTPDAYRALYHVSVLVFLFQTVLQLNTLTDPFVLSAYLGPRAVALYKPALLVVVSAYPFVASLSRQMRPMVTAYNATGRQEIVQEVVIRGTRMTILMAIPFCVLFGAFAFSIVRIWLGPQIGPGVIVTGWSLLLLSLLDLSTHIRETQGAIMLGLNRLRYISLVQVTGGFAAIVCGAVLVGILYYLGWGNRSVIGVAIPAVAIGWLQLALITLYVGRETSLGHWQYLREGFLRPGIVLLLTAAVAVALNVVVTPRAFFTLIPCLMLTGLAWLAACWFIGLDQQDQTRVRRVVARTLARFGMAAPTS